MPLRQFQNNGGVCATLSAPRKALANNPHLALLAATSTAMPLSNLKVCTVVFEAVDDVKVKSEVQRLATFVVQAGREDQRSVGSFCCEALPLRLPARVTIPRTAEVSIIRQVPRLW